MDEASQSGQRQFNRVLRTSEYAGAKTVFIGDKHQHQSVESGKAFERAQAHMPVAELGREAISRQTTGNATAVVSAVLDKKYHDATLSMDVKVIRPNQDALPEDATRASKRYAAREDNQAVITQIGRDYAELDRRARDGIMVITGTNDDRKAINHAIRSELKSREELAGAVDAMTLQKVDMEKAAARRAVSFEAGQVIETVTDAKRQNAGRGERFTVRVADSRTNTLSVIDDAGRRRVLDPGSIQFRAYNREVREFAPGDKVRFTENHQLGDGTRVRNGQRGEITAVDVRRGVLTVRTAGRNVEVPTQDAKLDYSYATTSHSGQGRDERAAWIHHNTEAGRHGDREALVNATRAKESQRLYTQDVAKAERQMGIAIDKSAAHDVSNGAPEPMPGPAHSPQQSRNDAHSLSY
jgi:ATP-dependent exoDNAse (exonuclease V) alpha subunit